MMKCGVSFARLTLKMRMTFACVSFLPTSASWNSARRCSGFAAASGSSIFIAKWRWLVGSTTSNTCDDLPGLQQGPQLVAADDLIDVRHRAPHQYSSKWMFPLNFVAGAIGLEAASFEDLDHAGRLRVRRRAGLLVARRHADHLRDCRTGRRASRAGSSGAPSCSSSSPAGDQVLDVDLARQRSASRVVSARYL